MAARDVHANKRQLFGVAHSSLGVHVIVSNYVVFSAEGKGHD